MRTEPSTKCSRNNFIHAWEDLPRNMYLSNPPKYSDPKWECKNCGLIKIAKKTEWIEFELPMNNITSEE